VLKVFGVRDVEATHPNPEIDSNTTVEPVTQPVDDVPKVPIEPDKSISAIHREAESCLNPIGSSGRGQLEWLAAGVAVGAIWTAQNGAGNRFGRVARSRRALKQNHLGSQNEQVS